MRTEEGTAAIVVAVDYSPAECVGIRGGPASVREPEGNGCTERFILTLMEQLLWRETFATVEELRQALLPFQDRSNHHWLLQRHGHRSAATVRATFALPASA